MLEVLRLARLSDSVELKLTVADDERVSVVRSLGIDPLDAQVRQVVFFDTPDLSLSKAGVVVRARRIQGRSGDAVVKLRPVEPGDLDPAVRRRPGFGVEVDAVPGGFVCSARLRTKVDNALVLAVVDGERQVRKLFSKAQRDLAASRAPDGVSLDELAVLGPINVLKVKFPSRGFDRPLAAELWHYPDGARVLELSTKCLPAEAFDVAAALREHLTAHGVDLSAPQSPKTRRALEHFAAALTPAPESRRRG